MEPVGGVRNAFGTLPLLEWNAGILQGLRFSALPDLGHGAADDVHQLVAKDEAGHGGDPEGQDDSGNADPQVLEVFEEGLFSIGIGVIPELKDLLEEKHPRRAGLFRSGIPNGRGL